MALQKSRCLFSRPGNFWGRKLTKKSEETQILYIFRPPDMHHPCCIHSRPTWDANEFIQSYTRHHMVSKTCWKECRVAFFFKARSVTLTSNPRNLAPLPCSLWGLVLCCDLSYGVDGRAFGKTCFENISTPHAKKWMRREFAAVSLHFILRAPITRHIATYAIRRKNTQTPSRWLRSRFDLGLSPEDVDRSLRQYLNNTTWAPHYILDTVVIALQYNMSTFVYGSTAINFIINIFDGAAVRVRNVHPSWPTINVVVIKFDLSRLFGRVLLWRSARPFVRCGGIGA